MLLPPARRPGVMPTWARVQAPLLTSVSPSTLFTNADNKLSIAGTNFGAWGTDVVVQVSLRAHALFVLLVLSS